MQDPFESDLNDIQGIEAVPTILDVVCRTTGMRFAAVARVTDERWIACSVLDEIHFGLKPGGELKLESTICHEIRQSREAVVIDDVAHDEVWRNHATPATYGFRSYISVPIILSDGSFFGTLCAIDPEPARVRTPEVISMFRLFAELIAHHLDSRRKLAAAESSLVNERADSELREQFVAVLGHDLRTPMRAISCLTDLLVRTPLNAEGAKMAALIRTSASRMVTLIDNLLDLARGRGGGGLTVDCNADSPLGPVLRSVIEELQVSHPDRAVDTTFRLKEPVNCDRTRVAQLFSNILGNALNYGSEKEPVRVTAVTDDRSLEIAVSNGGEPIPAAALQHLFQPFYRSAEMKNREGLGLGLFIAHEIATAHGGTLDVQSSAEETRLTFRMPLIR